MLKLHFERAGRACRPTVYNSKTRCGKIRIVFMESVFNTHRF